MQNFSVLLKMEDEIVNISMLVRPEMFKLIKEFMQVDDKKVDKATIPMRSLDDTDGTSACSPIF